jgi:hypothetical protein
MLLPREIYRNGYKIVVSFPDEKKRYPTIKASKNRSAINNGNNNNNDYYSNFGDNYNKPQLTTADGFTSGGTAAENNKSKMSSWGKRNPNESIIEREERRKRQEITREFAENCKALRERPDVYIVNYTSTGGPDDD